MKLSLVVLAATMTVACGESTSDSTTGSGGTGGSGKGGGQSGGTGGIGGSTATGGSATGGSATGGAGGSSTGGVSGSGTGGIATGGQAGATSVGNIGDACQNDEACPSTSFGTGVCETAAPGGYCTIVIAECPAGSGTGACPAGSACVNGIQFAGKPGDFCLKTCQSGNDCRSGYACCPWQGGAQPTSVCLVGASCP